MGLLAVVKVRRLIWVAVVIGSVVIIALCCAIPTALAATRLLPVYCVQEDNKIAITFDAAWGADKTKSIVDTLCQYDCKATFFLTGFWIDAYPAETVYIADHNMQIGNHSAHHRNMGKMNKEDCFAEIQSVNDQITTLTGKTPVVFRAPFGDYGNTLIGLLDEMNMTCIQWDVDSLDWKGLNADTLVQRVVSKVKGGSIILCHNNSDHILDALPTILATLQGKGYTLVTVSELIEGKKGKIDNSGKLHRN